MYKIKFLTQFQRDKVKKNPLLSLIKLKYKVQPFPISYSTHLLLNIFHSDAWVEINVYQQPQVGLSSFLLNGCSLFVLTELNLSNFKLLMGTQFSKELYKRPNRVLMH